MPLLEDIELIPDGPGPTPPGPPIQHSPDLREGAYLSEGGPVESEAPESPLGPPHSPYGIGEAGGPSFRVSPPKAPLGTVAGDVPDDFEIDYDTPVTTTVKKHQRTTRKSAVRKQTKQPWNDPRIPKEAQQAFDAMTQANQLMNIPAEEAGRYAKVLKRQEQEKANRVIEQGLGKAQHFSNADLPLRQTSTERAAQQFRQQAAPPQPFRETEFQRAQRIGASQIRGQSIAEQGTQQNIQSNLDFAQNWGRNWSAVRQGVTGATDNLSDMAAGLLGGMSEYVKDNGGGTDDNIFTHLSRYFQSGAAKHRIAAAATQNPGDQNTLDFGTLGHYIPEVAAGIAENYFVPGMGSPLGFGLQNVFRASGQGVIDPKELLKQFTVGVAQGKLLGTAGQIANPVGRTVAGGVAQAGPPMVGNYLRDQDQNYKQAAVDFLSGAGLAGLFGQGQGLNLPSWGRNKGAATPGPPQTGLAAPGQFAEQGQGQTVDAPWFQTIAGELPPAYSPGMAGQAPAPPPPGSAPQPPAPRQMGVPEPGPAMTLRRTNTVGMSPEAFEAFGVSPFGGGPEPSYAPYAQGGEDNSISARITRAKQRRTAQQSLQNIEPGSLAALPAAWEIGESSSPTVRRSPKRRAQLAQLTERLRERDTQQATEGHTDLANYPMTGNPLGEQLLASSDEDLAQAMTDMGGDPTTLNGDHDLMARWVMREMHSRLGGEEEPQAQAQSQAQPQMETQTQAQSGTQTQTQTSQPKSQAQEMFEQQMNDMAEANNMALSVQNRLGIPLSEAKAALRRMHEIGEQAHKEGRFFTPEESWEFDQNRNIFYDENDNLRIPKRVFDKLKLTLWGDEKEKKKQSDSLGGIAHRIDEPIDPNTDIETLTAIETLRNLKRLAPVTSQALFPETGGVSPEDIQRGQTEDQLLSQPTPTLSDYAGQRQEELKKKGLSLKGIDKREPEVSSREENAKAFVSQADPRLKLPDGSPRPVYHGTQSPREITEIDFDKLDPDSLFGPGFYTTQDSEIAAGDKGYVSTKEPQVGQGQEATEYLRKELKETDEEIPNQVNIREARRFVENHSELSEALKTKLIIGLHDLEHKPAPHAYKLYLDIRNPFDIDKLYSAGEVMDLTAKAAIQEGTPEDIIPFLHSEDQWEGRRLYHALLRIFEDKAKVNDFLKQEGYDGITHIGGQRSPGSRHPSLEEAQAQAEKVGGQVKRADELNPFGFASIDQNSNSFKVLYKVLQYSFAEPKLSDVEQLAKDIVDGNSHPSERTPETIEAAKDILRQTGAGQYDVEGHRVWIAFNKNQVKSATGNFGDYDPNMSGISQAFDFGDFLKNLPENWRSNPSKDKPYDFIYHGGPNKPAIIRAPDSMWKPYEAKYGRVSGINIPDYLYDSFNKFIVNNLSRPQAEAFTQAFARAQIEAESQGVRSVQFTKHGESPEEELTTVFHETWHAGQGKALPPEAKHGTELSSTPFVQENPYVQSALQTKRGQQIIAGTKFDPARHMAFELAAYCCQGPTGAQSMGLDSNQQLDYLEQYLVDLATHQGPEALIRFAEPVIMRPEVQEIYDGIKEQLSVYLGLTESQSIPLQRTGESQPSNPDVSLGGIAQARSASGSGHGSGAPPRGPTNRPGSGTAGAAPNPGGAGGGALVPAGAGGGGVGGPPAPMGLGGTIPPGSPKPPSIKNLKALMTQIDQTVIGRDLWQRAGGIAQKAALSDLAVGMFNIMTSTGQIPMKYVTMAPAAVMDSFYRNRNSPLTRSQKLQTAYNDMKKGLEPLNNIILSVHPANRAAINKKIDDLKYAFPELVPKLEGMAYGALQSLGKGTNLLNQANQMVTQLGYQNLPEDVQKRMQVYNQRRDFDNKWHGKGVAKAEQFYEFWLGPQILQEYFFRNSFFLGELSARTARQGFDLAAAFRGGPQALQKIPRDVLINALDEALKFSMAYQPKQSIPADPNRVWEGAPGRYMEMASYLGVQAIQKLGPFSMLVTGFPRMIYNGMNFSWEHSALGLLKPASRAIAIHKNPMAGPDEWGYDDFHDIMKGFVGMALMGAMMGVRHYLGGPEWYQIKTGITDKNNKPVYFDGRRMGPFASFLWGSDMVLRIASGRTPPARQIAKEIAQVGLAMSGLAPQDVNTFTTLGEFADWLGSGNGASLDAAVKSGGRIGGNFLAMFGNWVRPFRDLWASFDAKENHKSDFRKHPFLGPSIDLIPGVRDKYLDPLTSPTEGEVPIAWDPTLPHLGTNLKPGQNPSGEELSRLGIDIRQYLHPDPDPIIEAAQNKKMYGLLNEFGNLMMQDGEYIQGSDLQRQTMWADQLPGMAEEAHQEGLNANEDEAGRRQMKGQVPNPYRRKLEKLDEEIKKEYPKK